MPAVSGRPGPPSAALPSKTAGRHLPTQLRNLTTPTTSPRAVLHDTDTNSTDAEELELGARTLTSSLSLGERGQVDRQIARRLLLLMLPLQEQPLQRRRKQAG